MQIYIRIPPRMKNPDEKNGEIWGAKFVKTQKLIKVSSKK